MVIQTVCGSMKPETLGMTLLHEHLLFDAWSSYYGKDSENDQKEERLSLRNLGRIKRDPGALKDNLIMDDVDLMAKEVGYFKDAGGSCIVDATSTGVGNSIGLKQKLKYISEKTGVQIVSSTGFFLAETLDKETLQKSETDLTKQMVDDLTIGYEGTGIKAGIIGEIGASGELHDIEVRILKASAKAQKETGACITLHTACPNQFYASSLKDSWGQRTLNVLKILDKNGANLNRVIVGHADVSLITGFDEQLDVLKEGVYLAYDNFSQEHPYDKENTYGLSDWQRVHNIISFVKLGYIKQIVLSTDLWQKAMLIEYGGWGLVHILDNICPMLKRNGLNDFDIKQLLIENPRNILTI